ncbi:hypothetical protein GCM10009611_23390 [Arthrobacter roseus]
MTQRSNDAILSWCGCDFVEIFKPQSGLWTLMFRTDGPCRFGIRLNRALPQPNGIPQAQR